MIMLVSVTCSSGHLAKIHNDRDNLEKTDVLLFESHLQYESVR